MNGEINSTQNEKQNEKQNEEQKWNKMKWNKIICEMIDQNLKTNRMKKRNIKIMCV
jgi:hypothetical protein